MKIIHIVDENQNIIVTYTYDDYGTILNISGEEAVTIGNTNHIRYKNYYYFIK